MGIPKLKRFDVAGKGRHTNNSGEWSLLCGKGSHINATEELETKSSGPSIWAQLI